MKLKRLLSGLLITLLIVSQITPVYANLDGVLSPVTIGGSTSGNWTVSTKVDTLLRLSIVRQKQGTYAKFGFKNNYPNNGGFSLILGGSGNDRTNNIGHFMGGQLGYVNSSQFVFFDDAWIGDNVRNIGNMFRSAIMQGVNVYRGEGTSRLMTSNELTWTAYVTHATLQAASKGSTPLPSAAEMTNKVSFARIMNQTPEGRKPMANAMLCLGAFLNGRGADYDLGDIWNFYMGKESQFEYLLMLENLHYFNQNGKGLYIHQNQAIAAVAGRHIGLSEYAGDTLTYMKNILGPNSFQAADSTRIRKGTHTATFNLILDYFFDPNLATNAYARNTYYSRAARDDDEGKRMWEAEFTSTGPILTDYTKAKTGFAIYNENLPAPVVVTEVEGKHKLSSVEEAIEAELNEKVKANQFIDWKQEDIIIAGMADVIAGKLTAAAAAANGSATLQFDKVEYTITEVPSDHKGGFSIVNANMPLSYNLSYNAASPPTSPIKDQIAQAIRTQLSDKRAWPVSTEEGVFDAPGIYAWKYASKAEFVYRINSTRETISLSESKAQTLIRINTSSSEQLRWYNTPLAFAEVKEGTFSDDRMAEKWEAMNGVPTTETLYINAGGTPLYIDIIASYNTENWFKQYSGTDTTTCSGHTSGSGDDKYTWYHDTGSDSAEEEVPHTGSFVKITGITFRTADKAILESTKVFLNGKEEVPINGAVSATLDGSSKVYNKSLGVPASSSYGFTTAETSRHANTSGTCRSPNGQIALNQAKSTDSAQAFVQSDKITIIIEGATYEVIDGKYLSSPANSASNNDTTRNSFIPLKENWDVTNKIPYIAYVGQPRAAGARNKASASNGNKLRFYKTGVKIPLNQVNGLYEFEPENQVMVYGAAQTLVGENSGSVPENVTGYSGSGCTILVDYIDYLSTSAPHSLSGVDGPGPNPLILHNPVSAQDIWVYDIPDSTLQDQRIDKSSFTITRSYIDYAFKLTIPNTGSFEFNESGAKRADLLEHSLLKIHRNPGVLGKSFTGKYNTAFNTLPRGTSYPSGTPDSQNLNTDKWVRAKYIKLPFNAYYESTYPGGAPGFHNANTWIKLYDQGRVAAVSNDPIEFTFYITSDVPDMKDAVLTYLAEAINAPESLAGNPDALFADAEKNANTMRTTEGVYKDLEGDTVAELLSALYLFTLWNDTVNDIGNEVISEAEFIAYCLQTGRMPNTSVDRRCHKCFKNNCAGEAVCPKGKTVYSIGDEKFGMYITKTGYEFAHYLIDAELTTYRAVQDLIDADAVKTEKPAYTAESLASDNGTQNDAVPSADDEYKAWLHERVINYGASNLIEAARRNMIREIYLDIICKYDDYFDKKLLVLVEYIENQRCRNELISHLKQGNRATFKALEHITGLKLPKGTAEQRAMLDKTSSADFPLHPLEYTPRNPAERAEYSDRFYMYVIRVDGTKGFIESRGRLWHHNGSDFFMQKDHGGTYKASEGKTGLMVKDKCASIDELKESIKSTLENMGQQYTDHINGALKTSGVSPLYTS